jgi:hypothetical protein
MADQSGVGGDAPRRGRPPGTEETPESLIRKELMAHLKLYKQLREIVQKKIDSVGGEMDPDTLTKLMDLLRKGVVEMAKPIIAPARSGEGSVKGEVEEDPEKILAGLIGGNG